MSVRRAQWAFARDDSRGQRQGGSTKSVLLPAGALARRPGSCLQVESEDGELELGSGECGSAVVRKKNGGKAVLIAVERLASVQMARITRIWDCFPAFLDESLMRRKLE